MILMDKTGAWLVCFRRPHVLPVAFDTICQQRPLPSPFLPKFTPTTIQPYFTHPVFASGLLPFFDGVSFSSSPSASNHPIHHPPHSLCGQRLLSAMTAKSSFNLKPSLFAEFATDYARRWIAGRVDG